MKIFSIGDIHGRDRWMFLTHSSPYEFQTWLTAVEAGAPPIDDLWKDMPYQSYDKIVFVGDYVDSFDVKNVQILKNLQQIIRFKELLPDKVVLLLGNHDVQYFTAERCSGYRPEARPDLEDLFRRKLDLFQLAYEVETAKRTYLWTHAGVSSGWYKVFLKELKAPDMRFGNILEDHNPETLAEHLNLGWKFRLKSIHNIDAYSGGYEPWAGPLWVRPGILNDNPLPNVTQINGHTPQRGIQKHIVKDNAVHYLIDCLENPRPSKFYQPEDDVVEGLTLTLEPLSTL